MNQRKKFFLFFFLLIFVFFLEKADYKESFKNSNPFLEAKTFSQENLGFVFFQEIFLRPSISPIQIFSKSLAVVEEKREILEYEVKEGETISSIAQKFNLKEETIIFANNLSKNSKLKVGQKLIILPVDGVLHEVKRGETISEISKKYNVNPKDIIYFNEILNEKIYPGEILIIPGARPFESFSQNLPKISFLICPLPPCRITQGLHFYNAIDFSNGKCGEFVLAAASGKVIFARPGWNHGIGNQIKILHQNGVITQYGHLKEILVKEGDEVFQGQIIGTVGKTGIATGCHLHFGVFGAKNPFST